MTLKYEVIWKMSRRTKMPAKAPSPLSIRMDGDVRSGLEKAAKDDRRPVSHLAQKIIADWLKEKGYLK
jgi:hypothetical protein